MITILDTLKGINAYPIPVRTLQEVAIKRGLNLDEELKSETTTSRGFLLAKADLLNWLALAPNVSQGGQNYSFNEDQRTALKNNAHAIYSALGEDLSGVVKPNFGYKGNKL